MKHLNLIATLGIIASLAACGGNSTPNNNQNNNNNVPVATPTPLPLPVDEGAVGPVQDIPAGDDLGDDLNPGAGVNDPAVNPLEGKADPEYVRAHKICTAFTTFKGVNVCDKFTVGYLDPSNPNANGFSLYRHFNVLRYPANQPGHANEVIGINYPVNSNDYIICYDDAGYAEQGMNELFCDKITVPAPEAPAPAANNNNNGGVIVIGEEDAPVGNHSCPVANGQIVWIPKTMTCTNYYKLRDKCTNIWFRSQHQADCRIVAAAAASMEAAPANNNNAANNHNFDNIDLNSCHWNVATQKFICGDDSEDEEEQVDDCRIQIGDNEVIDINCLQEQSQNRS